MRKDICVVFIAILVAVSISIGCIEETPDEEPEEPYSGPTKVTIQIYDSQSTLNPVKGMSVKMYKLGTGISISTATNTKGTVTFDGNVHSWLVVPYNYSIKLDNNYEWRWVYSLTLAEHTFTYYIDELP